MTPLVLFGIIVLLPVLVATILRINAAVLFMSLCVGAILVQFVAGGATGPVVHSLASHGQHVHQSTVRLGLLLAPMVLTAIFMLHSVKGHTKLLWNILPAAATGLLTVLLVKPLLTVNYQVKLEHSQYWQQINKNQAIIVAAGAALSLLFLWVQRHGVKEHSSKHLHSSK